MQNMMLKPDPEFCDRLLSQNREADKVTYYEALGNAFVTGNFWMRCEWVDADVALRRLLPDPEPRIGFLDGVTIFKHRSVGFTSYITPSGTDWLYEAWIKSCVRQSDVSFYEHVTGKAAAPLLKLSVIAVRQAWGIR